jgi:hypothetical protein
MQKEDIKINKVKMVETIKMILRITEDLLEMMRNSKQG